MSSSSIVSWPISGRKKSARKPEKMARALPTKKGSWPARVGFGACFLMMGKT